MQHSDTRGLTNYDQLFADSKCWALFEKTPWALAGELEFAPDLERSIRNESERLWDFGHKNPHNQIHMHLICHLSSEPTKNWEKDLENLVHSIRLQTWPWWTLHFVTKASQNDHPGSISWHQKLLALMEKEPRIKLDHQPAQTALSSPSCAPSYAAQVEIGDVLHPQILGFFARHIVSTLSALYYCDDASLDASGLKVGNFAAKPEFNRATLLRVNYLRRLVLIRMNFIEAVDVAAMFDRSHNEDNSPHTDQAFFLRLSNQRDFSARHIRAFGILSKNLKIKAFNKSAYEKMIRNSISTLANRPSLVSIQSHNNESSGESFWNPVQVTYSSPSLPPLHVIIPFRDQIPMTIRCLETLEQQNYPVQINVLLVDNNSTANLLGDLTQWLSGPKKHLYALTKNTIAYNYSRLNNDAVAKLPIHNSEEISEDLILFLNNDVEFIDANTLIHMASELALHPDIGVVGLRLHYPEKISEKISIQHAGMRLLKSETGLPRSVVVHRRDGEALDFVGHIVPGVTFACAMTRHGVWKALGGIDEAFFANGCSDVDFCLRARKLGFHIFYLGEVAAIHHEAKSRKGSSEAVEELALQEAHGGLLSAADFGPFPRLGSVRGALDHNRGEKNDWAQTPLRYRLADQVNHVLKVSLGPLHKYLKQKLQFK